MIDHKKISELRRNYKIKELSVSQVELNPFTQFEIWFNEALESRITEPNAFILATADNKCKPSARTLLLKDFNEKGFVFYTNYESRKGKELEENNQGAMLFFWADLERQIRVEGKITKITQEESTEYFKTRPYKSRLGAWASNQSTVIESRFVIVKKFIKFLIKFGTKNIPVPPYWGGYRLTPEEFEFWQGRENRLHDRIRYRMEDESWKIERLSP
ncbi:MAG: pyridoxamine 5'-phosphate oxidase [Ignavibacteria bacterium]|nr:pyridoxamine 5'-phosphate oxidase [Ignavibacteria bacterium]